jgi:hypothetical protein
MVRGDGLAPSSVVTRGNAPRLLGIHMPHLSSKPHYIYTATCSSHVRLAGSEHGYRREVTGFCVRKASKQRPTACSSAASAIRSVYSGFNESYPPS